MKIAVYCVNYHTYESLQNFLFSADKAAARSRASVTVVVADNSVDKVQPIPTDFPHIEVKALWCKKNLGYFGAIRQGQLSCPPQDFDYAIISNVDLELKEDFFCALENRTDDSAEGWIAPCIYSNAEKRDRNPKILKRYSVSHLRHLLLLFKHPALYWLYTKTLYRRKKMFSYPAGMQIYAGHGSFIILTKEYISRCGMIDYPVFLYCEEIYLAEKCRQANLRVVYDPSLVVTDKEHVSTGKIKKSRNCAYNVEALTYIINNYYNH